MKIRGAVAVAMVVAGLGLGIAVAPTALADDGPGSLEIRKVDQTGKPLPGASVAVVMCTRVDESSPLDCEDVTDKPFIIDPVKATGLSGNLYDHLDVLGPWMHPIVQCIGLRELAAPQGYSLSPAGTVMCKGPGGWSTEHAKGLTIDVHGVVVTAGETNDWAVTNTPGADHAGRTVISLPNRRIEASPAPTDAPPPATTPKAPAPSTNAPKPPATQQPLPKTGADGAAAGIAALVLAGSVAAAALVGRRRPRR